MPRIKQNEEKYAAEDFRKEVRIKQGERDLMSVTALAEEADIPRTTLTKRLSDPMSMTFGEFRTRQFNNKERYTHESNSQAPGEDSGGGASAAWLYRERDSDVSGSRRNTEPGGDSMKDKKRKEPGGEATIAAMDEYSRAEIGRKTYRFVRRCMQNPELREKIQARAAELRAEARS